MASTAWKESVGISLASICAQFLKRNTRLQRARAYLRLGETLHLERILHLTVHANHHQGVVDARASWPDTVYIKL